MKQHAAKTVPSEGKYWNDGAKSFINKGQNGRWRDVLTEEDCRVYEQAALNELGQECADWLQGKGA